jgi:hypothetical protein
MRYKDKKQQVSVLGGAEFKHAPNPWEERAKRIQERVDAFAKTLAWSPLYTEAEALGYGLKFYRYATHVAKIQAQFIEGDKVGYNQQIIFNGKKTNADDCWKFLRAQERICQSGDIEVRYPTGLLAEWKAQAERERAAVENKSS